MSSASHEETLGRGVIPPLVTPCTAKGNLDDEGFARLIDSVIAGGVDGVFVLGTTGEGPALSQQMQRQVVVTAVRAVAGRVPVLVGVTDSSAEELLNLADASAEAGADAVVVAPPPYSPAEAPELNHYLDFLNERLPLPMFLYNIPSRTVAVPSESLAHAMTLPGCIGYKDSSGSMLAMHEAISRRDATRPDFKLLVGPEELLAESVLFGADGGVSGGANLFPRLFASLYRAAADQDLETCRRLQRVVMSISMTFYRAGRHPSSFVKAVKHGLKKSGICEGHLLWPYEPFNAEDSERIDRLWEEAHAKVQEALPARVG